MNTTSVHVYAVKVADRMDGLYLFSNESYAEAFRTVVEECGGEAYVTEEPINLSATDLIEAEREMDQ